jgi:hypothetical protein
MNAETASHSIVTFMPLDIADFGKTTPEGGHKMRRVLRGCNPDEPYYGHRRLLRLRRQRPRRRAAEQRDELATFTVRSSRAFPRCAPVPWSTHAMRLRRARGRCALIGHDTTRRRGDGLPAMARTHDLP